MPLLPVTWLNKDNLEQNFYEFGILNHSDGTWVELSWTIKTLIIKTSG